MLNKIKFVLAFALVFPAMADDVAPLEIDISAASVENYDMDGSLFQQISDMEQQKVLLQLQKEKAQADLDLDRLAAEKIRLHIEIDDLSGRTEQQKQQLEAERARLEAEAEKIARDRENLSRKPEQTEPSEAALSAKAEEPAPAPADISKKYRLVDIVGAGKQLLATIEDKSNGQRRRIAAGKIVGEYEVKSISLEDGVAFEKDGEIEILNIGKEKSI
jgi:hypothetical protein